MNNIFTFLERFIQLRSTNPCIKAGQILCFFGIGGSTYLALTASIQGLPLKVEWTAGNNLFLSFIAGIAGIVLLVIGAFIPSQAARSTIVTLMGIPGTSANVPDNAIGKPYSLYNPRHFNFQLDQSNQRAMVQELDNYCRKSIDKQIINDSRNGKVFFAGLARVPCLFAIGTLFRSSAVEVEPLERFRNPDRWARLKLYQGKENELSVTGNPRDLISCTKEIGILISLTDEILMEQVPASIRDHCILVRLTPETNREAISTLPDLHDFCKQFKRILDDCSNVAETIHLFICAQSAVAFEMGRVYQEGMHSKLLIHNFTPGEGYTWALEVNKGNFKYIEC